MLHFTKLGETLSKLGLMDITGLITNPANVINYDKCTNMINGTRNGNVGMFIRGPGGAATWSEKQSTLLSKIDKMKGLTIGMTFEYPGLDGDNCLYWYRGRILKLSNEKKSV